MKQILQDLGTGETVVADIPVPTISQNQVLIRNSVSLISTGTERMLVDFGKANLLEKARQQPDKVRMVLDKARTEGLLTTFEAVKSKLNQKVPIGYASVGAVVETAKGISEFSVGDRVVSNGSHAEYVSVGRNLCALIPDEVLNEEAAFTVPGAIALQGVRLAAPTIGELFVVTGLGLIGLLTVQMLKANGCRVIGIDIDDAKLELAKSYGAETVNPGVGEDPIEAARVISRGRGVDGVIITASSQDNSIVHQAAGMCRQRGRIVLVGVVGLNLQRSDFYEKEITFQVSCSYGPGRYDPNYEARGHDYPIGFVRWTEQRNFEAVLDMLSSGKLNVERLISAEFPIDDARSAYGKLSSDRSALGILLTYPENVGPVTNSDRICTIATSRQQSAAPSGVTIGALGAGNYASRVLLPAFRSCGARLQTIVSAQGVSGTNVGRKLGFEASATDAEEVFSNEEINTIVIATRHNTHAEYVVRALDAGKNVFVEKPLALTVDEVDAVNSAYNRAIEAGRTPRLMVGFNRRFAPFICEIKGDVQRSSVPISLIYNCNAGFIESDSWVHDLSEGGGRIVGEACHFIDLARFLTGSTIANVAAIAIKNLESERDCRDTAVITLTFANGSVAVINYFANGHRAYSKERLEVYQSGRMMVMDNFRSLKAFGGSVRNRRSARANRGQVESVSAFNDAIVNGRPSPIDFAEIIEVAQAAIEAANQVRT